MSYGLKIFSGGVYNPVVFDSSTFTRYSKIITNGSVTWSSGSTSSSISAPGYNVVYVTVPSVNDSTPLTINRLSNSFTIRNDTVSTQTFAYFAMRNN